MCSADMVTNFVIRKDRWITAVGTFEYHGHAKTALEAAGLSSYDGAIKHEIDMCTVADLVNAMEKHCKSVLKLESMDYFNVASEYRYDNPGKLVPVKRVYDIAYSIEGSNEGYYVHFGCLIKDEDGCFGGAVKLPTYMDFGFAKLYSRDDASALCAEAQRFLTAASWN